MKKTILVLANSVRRGCHCIAGREVSRHGGGWHYGPWIRPVSKQGEGEVPEKECLYADGTQPAVLDIAEVTLMHNQGCAFQPENWVIDSSVRWKKIYTISSNILTNTEERPSHLWYRLGERSDRIHTTVAVESLNPFQSLCLFRPNNLKFRVWEAVDEFRGSPRK